MTNRTLLKEARMWKGLHDNPDRISVFFRGDNVKKVIVSVRGKEAKSEIHVSDDLVFLYTRNGKRFMISQYDGSISSF